MQARVAVLDPGALAIVDLVRFPPKPAQVRHKIARLKTVFFAENVSMRRLWKVAREVQVVCKLFTSPPSMLSNVFEWGIDFQSLLLQRSQQLIHLWTRHGRLS
jgi:hypothetical protein